MFNLFNFKNVIVGPAGVNNVNTLYGLGVNNSTTIKATLYLLDPQTGAATAIGKPIRNDETIRAWW